jgi:hypothetical protein
MDKPTFKGTMIDASKRPQKFRDCQESIYIADTPEKLKKVATTDAATEEWYTLGKA